MGKAMVVKPDLTCYKDKHTKNIPFRPPDRSNHNFLARLERADQACSLLKDDFSSDFMANAFASRSFMGTNRNTS